MSRVFLCMKFKKKHEMSSSEGWWVKNTSSAKRAVPVVKSTSKEGYVARGECVMFQALNKLRILSKRIYIFTTGS